MSTIINGFEITSQNPGWIHKKKIVSEYFEEIFIFYVVNTPCQSLSASSITLNDYGWNAKIWRNERLKNVLFSVANLQRGKTFITVSKTNEMKQACKNADLSKNFHKKRSTERIVIYKNSLYNEFLNVLCHIRNSLAHGRFSIFNDDDRRIYVLEDGIKKNGDFQVRARMILKETTLYSWINILQAGKLPDELENQN